MTSPQWSFAGYRLDPASACLWREEQEIVLPPKAFDVLHYLVTHADRLVLKDELLDAIWPSTAVSDAVVRVAIGAIRKALDDAARTPRYIATVARRGYRFLAPVTRIDAEEPMAPPTALSPPPSAAISQLLVEREPVLQRLRVAWNQARQGQRQGRSLYLSSPSGSNRKARLWPVCGVLRR